MVERSMVRREERMREREEQKHPSLIQGNQQHHMTIR